MILYLKLDNRNGRSDFVNFKRKKTKNVAKIIEVAKIFQMGHN